VVKDCNEFWKGNMKNRLTVKRSQAGFTLIELMVVIAIVAILLAVALPAYQNQVIRGHRAAAKSEMLDIANRQQQFLLANRSYAATVGALGYTLPAEVAAHYTPTITLGAAAAPSYSMTFTAIGRQASDGPLTITSEGAKTPVDKWER
jgi:type IV pilus assembly protein PilE